MEEEHHITETFMEDYKYLYYLVECNCSNILDYNNITTYGIKIQKVKDKEIVEEATVKDVCTKEGEAIKFVNFLKDNTIAPNNLIDFVEDYIDEFI